MKYQRLHIRVPASGDAILLEKGDVKIEASVINVSVGGLCFTAPSDLWLLYTSDAADECPAV